MIQAQVSPCEDLIESEYLEAFAVGAAYPSDALPQAVRDPVAADEVDRILFDRTDRRLPRVCVALAYESEGRVLCVRRTKPPEAQSWSLPAGHVEYGEGLASAVVREVFEETGLTCIDVSFLGSHEYITEDFHFVVLIFTCRMLMGRLAPGDDAETAAFVDWDSLESQPCMAGLLRRAETLLHVVSGGQKELQAVS